MLRRMKLDAKRATAAPVQRFVGARSSSHNLKRVSHAQCGPGEWQKSAALQAARLGLNHHNLQAAR